MTDRHPKLWHLLPSALLVCLVTWQIRDNSALGQANPGHRSGGGYLVMVTANPTEGLEAGIPQTSWYAKGIALDQEEHWGKSVIAYAKAIEEFEKQLINRPQWSKMIRGWLLKAKFMSQQSRLLNQRDYGWTPPSANTLLSQGSAKHNKWLAIRAFTGRDSPRLRIETIEAYEKTLDHRPDFDVARLSLAALYHEIGQHSKGRLIYSQVRNPNQSWLTTTCAYYFTAAGDWDQAFALIGKAIAYSSSSKYDILQANQFDRLRTDPRFKKLVGEP